MKHFFPDFKKFITRGNVVDMSVGIIVGGAFTAIVNGMSNFILKPVVNAIMAKIFGKDSLSEMFTFLVRVDKDVLDEAGNKIGSEVDLAESIYIDWGSFIHAILNFFIIAFVLFTIVKIINKMRERQDALEEMSKGARNKRKELRKNGIKPRDKKAVEAYYAEKKRLADEAAAAEAAALAEAARRDREANPTTEDLLKMILAEMKNK